jgi:hypothetical protein
LTYTSILGSLSITLYLYWNLSTMSKTQLAEKNSSKAGGVARKLHSSNPATLTGSI